MDKRDLSREIQEPVERDTLCWWWLGQSGFVFKTDSVTVVTDPYLSGHLERITRDSPTMRHNRMMPVPIPPFALLGIDYICCTHDHLDHYDPETVIPILTANPGARVIVPRAARKSLIRDKIEEDRIITVDTSHGCGDRQKGFSIKAIRGRHNEFDYSEEWDYPYLGYIVQMGRYRLYHGGDTIWFPELPGLLKGIGIDIACIPINGGDEDRVSRGFMSNLKYDEAARLGKEIGAHLVIPCHYDMFDINTEQIGRFVNYANRIGVPYEVPLPGEKGIYRGEGR